MVSGNRLQFVRWVVLIPRRQIRELERLVSDAALGDTIVFLLCEVAFSRCSSIYLANTDSRHSDQQLATEDIHEEDNQDECMFFSPPINVLPDVRHQK